MQLLNDLCAPVRLYSFACSARIWSSCCHYFVEKFPFVVVSLMHYVSWSAVSDAKLMKYSSVSPCFTLLVLLYPTAPFVWSSYSLSWYDYWKCTLKHTHVWLLDEMLFHMLYACVYSCVARILVMPISARCRLENEEFPDIENSRRVSI